MRAPEFGKFVPSSCDQYFKVNSVSKNNKELNNEENKKWTQVIKINKFKLGIRLDIGAEINIFNNW